MKITLLTSFLALAAASPVQQLQERQRAPICNVVGYDRENPRASRLDSTGKYASASACQNLCNSTRNCKSFAVGNNTCLLYQRTLERNVNAVRNSPYTFYEVGCPVLVAPTSRSSTRSPTSTTTSRRSTTTRLASSTSSVRTTSPTSTGSASSTSTVRTSSATASLSSSPGSRVQSTSSSVRSSSSSAGPTLSTTSSSAASAGSSTTPVSTPLSTSATITLSSTSAEATPSPTSCSTLRLVQDVDPPTQYTRIRGHLGVERCQAVCLERLGVAGCKEFVVKDSKNGFCSFSTTTTSEWTVSSDYTPASDESFSLVEVYNMACLAGQASTSVVTSTSATLSVTATPTPEVSSTTNLSSSTLSATSTPTPFTPSCGIIQRTIEIGAFYDDDRLKNEEGNNRVPSCLNRCKELWGTRCSSIAISTTDVCVMAADGMRAGDYLPVYKGDYGAPYLMETVTFYDVECGEQSTNQPQPGPDVERGQSGGGN